ncbi:hypothetical protein [Chromobacterium phragmitis]|uniref:hypothetical protein n=1 Tax=Chromobacterium phragmitis TaxID=2202141 RepID=UPI0032672593
MNQYPVLKNVLISIMSVDVGLSEEREEAALMASLGNVEYRQKLRYELESAFLDKNFSWMNLLDNESYCVFRLIPRMKQRSTSRNDYGVDSFQWILDLFAKFFSLKMARVHV